jgi:endonuclease YncB( thermonuclease family)
MPTVLPFRRGRRRGLFARLRRTLVCGVLAVAVAAGGSYLLAPSGGGVPGRSADPRPVVRYETKPETRAATRPRVTSSRSATVIDGDSLRIGSTDIRLDGIDAPELGQTCRYSDGRVWACGRAAKVRLAEFVSGPEVICTEQGRDRYGRTLAICSAGAVRDMGEALVRAGLALNYDRYTSRYREAQEDARRVRRGVWSGSFDRPEDWRAGNRRREAVGLSGR